MRIRCCIFDWAGTTVDYGCFAPLDAFLKIFQERGIEITHKEARKPMGLLKRDHIKALCEMPRISKMWSEAFGRKPSEMEIDSLYNEFENSLLSTLKNFATPIDGVVETVNILKKRGIAIGSTTGYTREMIDIVAEQSKLAGYSPDIIVTPCEVSSGRPAPWMIYKNCELLNTYPLSSVVKVGDTLSDIKEGVNASVWSVGIIEGSSVLGLSRDEFNKLDPKKRSGLMESVREEFYRAGANYVINNISDLPNTISLIEEALSEGKNPISQQSQLKEMKNSSIENPYLLLTPGPLSTSKTVKSTMLRDWCTWDEEYNIGVVQDIRRKLEKLTGAPQIYTSILLQGSGTFAVEATIGTMMPRMGGTLLICANGAYGERMIKIANYLGIKNIPLRVEETSPITAQSVEKAIADYPQISHVAVVHNETTTGILNPIEEIAPVVKRFGKKLMVDAMSSFGGVPISMEELEIDWLVSSANKCIQGVPGFGFILANRKEIENCANNARSYSLDLYDQWRVMEESSGKWRFTSPTHVVRAFQQALKELDEEGGVEARHRRYCENHRTLINGMKELGFKQLLPTELHSPIISSFYTPSNCSDGFNILYKALKRDGFVIYPGKVSEHNCFRIGTIGDVYPVDIVKLLEAIRKQKNLTTL